MIPIIGSLTASQILANRKIPAITCLLYTSGRSGIIENQKDSSSHTFPQILPPAQLQLLKKLIASYRRDDIRCHVFELLDSWKEKQYPQTVIENGLRQLLRAFLSSQSNPDELKLYLAEYRCV